VPLREHRRWNGASELQKRKEIKRKKERAGRKIRDGETRRRLFFFFCILNLGLVLSTLDTTEGLFKYWMVFIDDHKESNMNPYSSANFVVAKQETKLCETPPRADPNTGKF